MAFHEFRYNVFLIFAFILSVPCYGHFRGFRNYVQLDSVKDKGAVIFDEQWFIQKLDHFNGADSRVWKQVSDYI